LTREKQRQITSNLSLNYPIYYFLPFFISIIII